ncbi:MAG: penicillin-binding protein activator [Bdellovibrionales bacterium]|nr:penicillin-binding protein activator [Bdellovibrionales bacterium]
MKLIHYIASLFFLSLIFLSQSRAEQAAQDNVLRIGVILPLTGEAASVGQAIQNGMQFAYDQLPTESQSRLKIAYEDDGLNPARTISAYRKLLSEQRIDGVVVASSGTSKALAPHVEKDKVPMLAIATDPKVVEGRNYAMNFWVSAESEVSTAIPEARRRGYKTLARIITQHDFPVAVKSHFDEMANGEFTFLLDEEYPADEKNFRSYLTKVASSEAELDAIYVGLMPGQLGIFAKQVKEMGISLPMFGFETFEDSQEVKVSNGSLVGQWYVNTDDPSEAFHNAFKLKYPKSSLYGASNGNDIVLILAEAAKRELDRDALNGFLHTLTDFTGALGTYSATADNRFTLPAAVKVVTESGFAKIDSLQAKENELAKPFAIGAILPLSGTGASIGASIRKGIELAYDELSEGEKQNIALIFEDDAWQPSSAVAAYQKLKSVNNIDAVFVCGSSIGNAVVPLAEQQGVISISIGASDYGIVANRNLAFLHWVTPDVEAKVFVDELKKRKYQRMAMIYGEQEGILASIPKIRQELESAGLSDKIVLEKSYLPDATQYRDFVTQAKAKQVDGVIVMLLPGALSTFAKQSRQASLDVDLMGLELFEDENEVRASDGALIGQWYVNASDGSDHFNIKYKQRFGENPGFGSANGYDSMKLIAKAIEKSESEATSVAHYLRTLQDFHGAAGVYSASGDNRFTLPAAVKLVTADGFETISR